jgi:deazaflavin-dependent oxidoreductase (nitroreductase family)
MTTSYADANALHRLMRRFAATRPGSWFFARVLHHADRVVYRLTRQRTTLAGLLSGLPVVMLTTTGARSGRETTVPVLGYEEGDAVILVASNYGQAHHPAWYHNLRANPRGRLAVRCVWRDVVAEEISSPERERYLAIAGEIYPGYVHYEERAAPRRISVFRLIPP